LRGDGEELLGHAFICATGGRVTVDTETNRSRRQSCCLGGASPPLMILLLFYV
jgi:hypothetical protein